MYLVDAVDAVDATFRSFKYIFYFFILLFSRYLGISWKFYTDPPLRYLLGKGKPDNTLRIDAFFTLFSFLRTASGSIHISQGFLWRDGSGTLNTE